MSVTNTYGLGNATAYSIENDQGDHDFQSMTLTALADGSIAYGGYYPGAGYSLVGLGVDAGANDAVWAVDGAGLQLDQLASGYVVGADIESGDVVFQMFGDPEQFAFNVGHLNDFVAVNCDIAALRNGGFVIADQLKFTATDSDIQVSIRDGSANDIKDFSIDVSTADDESPSVAGLKNGNFVVAWDRADAGTTSGYFAIYRPDGTERVEPRLFDQNGADNSGMQVVGLAKGGFAVAYVDSGWTGSDNISLEVFKANGNFVNALDVSTGDTAGAASNPNSAPSITVLADGTIAVSWTHAYDSVDSDIYMQLLDGKTGQPLFAAPELVSKTDLHLTGSSITALGDSQVLVSYIDNGAAVGARSFALHIERDGGAGKDHIIGSDLVETINGNDGNDLLKGGGGNDTISGGDGKDVINGGAGTDVMTGGAGKDVFQFTSVADIANTDFINDLEKGDHINLKGIDADLNTTGDQAFTIVTAFTHHAGEMTVGFDPEGNQTVVLLDLDGDGVADGSLCINGDASTFHNFVL